MFLVGISMSAGSGFRVLGAVKEASILKTSGMITKTQQPLSFERMGSWVGFLLQELGCIACHVRFETHKNLQKPIRTKNYHA